MAEPTPLLTEIKDPETFIALKRLCSYVTRDVWATISSSPEYEYAVEKSKEYEDDVKMLAEIDLDLAWGQVKNKTGGDIWVRDGGDFNPWYDGTLSLTDILNSFEPLAEELNSSTTEYLQEVEFLHYYRYLQSKLPPTVPEPTVIRLANLHPKIIEHCKRRFDSGHFADAILAAYKVVFNEIKDITNIHDMDGKQLVEKVFSLNGPVIRLNDLITQSDKDEQLGFMLLFSGAAVGIRNPKAHDLVSQEDKMKTLRYLTFASLLMERLDARKSP